MMILDAKVNAQTVAFDPMGLNMYRGSFDSDKREGVRTQQKAEAKKNKMLGVTDVLSRLHDGRYQTL